jgi:hypothetical protein
MPGSPLPAAPPSAMPCKDRRGKIVVHAVDVDELRAVTDRGGLRSRRAVCGRRKLRFVVYFNGTAEVCADCRKLVPDLAVPEPGAILYRELGRVSSISIGASRDEHTTAPRAVQAPWTGRLG